MDTELAPDHFAALTVASLPAARSALSSSSSGASPTVTASTATPWAASTSRSICSTPADSVAAAGALGLFAGRVSGCFRTRYGAAANDLNRIFRVDDAEWRRAPQFNALILLNLTPRGPLRRNVSGL